MGRPSWDYQFRETEWERQERWRKTRSRLRAEGKCWQCAKPVADCKCPNVEHRSERAKSQSGENHG